MPLTQLGDLRVTLRPAIASSHSAWPGPRRRGVTPAASAAIISRVTDLSPFSILSRRSSRAACFTLARRSRRPASWARAISSFHRHHDDIPSDRLWLGVTGRRGTQRTDAVALCVGRMVLPGCRDDGVQVGRHRPAGGGVRRSAGRGLAPHPTMATSPRWMSTSVMRVLGVVRGPLPRRDAERERHPVDQPGAQLRPRCTAHPGRGGPGPASTVRPGSVIDSRRVPSVVRRCGASGCGPGPAGRRGPRASVYRRRRGTRSGVRAEHVPHLVGPPVAEATPAKCSPSPSACSRMSMVASGRASPRGHRRPECSGAATAGATTARHLGNGPARPHETRSRVDSLCLRTGGGNRRANSASCSAVSGGWFSNALASVTVIRRISIALRLQIGPGPPGPCAASRRC